MLDILQLSDKNPFTRERSYSTANSIFISSIPYEEYPWMDEVENMGEVLDEVLTRLIKVYPGISFLKVHVKKREKTFSITILFLLKKQKKYIDVRIGYKTFLKRCC